MALTKNSDRGNVLAENENRYHQLLFTMGDHDQVKMNGARDELMDSVWCEATRAGALSALTKSIKDPYHVIRANAINILGSVAGKVDISMAFPALALALSDSFADTRINSSIALLNAAQWSKHDLSPYLSEFGRALKDQESHVRINSAWAIGFIAGKESDISSLFPLLIETLDDHVPNARYFSATALGVAANHGADISSAFPALFQHLDDSYAHAASTARWALERASESGRLIDIADARLLLADCVDRAVAKNGESAGAEARKMAALMYSRFCETARKSKAAIFGDVEAVDRSFKAPLSIRSPGDRKNKLFRAPLARV